MKGVFGLAAHTDLFKKLEWEFERLTGEPNSAYLAYNFFVTAWHLLEWKYPDPHGTATRKQIRDQTIELQICEHLAVGAKHFEPTNTKLKSVSGSKRSGVWAEGFWGRGFWAEGSWASSLVVILTGDAQQKYGDSIKAVDLARQVMDYWRAHV
jgi:hypothetical protein